MKITQKIKNILAGLMLTMGTIGIVATSTATMSGCALIKDGEEISWTKVGTVSAVIQVAAQTSTYAVCVKNQDLSPIFKAIGEGLVVLSGQATEEQLTPEQIEAYISSVLTEGKWGTLSVQINGILQTMINAYTDFYNVNKDKFKEEHNASDCRDIADYIVDNSSAVTYEDFLAEIENIARDTIYKTNTSHSKVGQSARKRRLPNENNN